MDIIVEIIKYTSYLLTIAGFTTLCQKLYNHYLNKKFEKHINVTGYYITEYEDIVDGNKVIRKAPAFLKQKGKKITGTTRFAQSDNEWLIKGEIVEGDNISGIFYSISQADNDYGNLFLKINKGNKLTGIWSGYDSVNKIINGGLYNFYPKIKTGITPIKHEHYGYIIDIAEKQLGKNYITETVLDNCLCDNGNNIGLVSQIVNDNKTVITGFITGKMISHNDVVEMYKSNLDSIPQVMMQTLKFGFIQSIAVSSDYTNMGIGKELVAQMDQELQKLGANVILTTAWKNGDNINIGSILRSLGYKESLTIPEYWHDDSIKNIYSCPRCGKPCHCSAVIFYKVI